MTGAEHYDEAERLARLAYESLRADEDDVEPGHEARIQALMAIAHVHATLAIAAPKVGPGELRLEPTPPRPWPPLSIHDAL